MRKKLILLVLMVAVTIIIVSLLLNVSSNKENTESYQNINYNSSSVTSILPMYIVKEYDGKVSVFRFGENLPFEILEEIVYYSLPEYDREQLKKGISVYTDEELQRLIEDFDG